MEWLFQEISVKAQMGPFDDKDIGLSVATKNIEIGLGMGITIQESSSARNRDFWPSISMGDPQRRKNLFNAVTNALEKADSLSEKSVCFFTTGFETSRIPSWEVAEEIVRAIHTHCQKGCQIEKVIIVVGSPTQLSSLQYALDNAHIIAGPGT
ncbi:MAG: hypothetical protein ACFFEF_03305 [Candidatus Thorarchaeota archaeon]